METPVPSLQKFLVPVGIGLPFMLVLGLKSKIVLISTMEVRALEVD